MRPLAILRPEPGASATADVARRLGLEPVRLPLFRIEPLVWTEPDPSRFDALLFTSANGIRCSGPELQRFAELPVFAVGETTAAEAHEEGFVVQSVGRGGIEALLASIPPNLRLLHLCGAHRRDPCDSLRRITAVPVYRSAELPLPEYFGAVEGAVAAVHSPRAAAQLAKLAVQADIACNRTAIVAISAETAAAAGGGWQRVGVAEEPNDRALLALAARLCHNCR